MPIEHITKAQKQSRLLQESLMEELSPKHKLYKLKSLIDWNKLEENG